MEEVAQVSGGPKKPRLVFTDLQRRTLQAIFKVCLTKEKQNFNNIFSSFLTIQF